jgi:hypothetical protein
MMIDDNKRNLLYFESSSMRKLYNSMEIWQKDNHKRLLSTNIQKDGDLFCCIALSNPTEVIICNGLDSDQVGVDRSCLEVNVLYSDV